MNTDRNLYILCGGQSQRMGRDKALIEMDGKSLLEQVIKKAELYFGEVNLLCGQNIYDVKNRQLSDKIENAGPLAGLLEALKDSANSSMNHIAIIPVDLPNITRTTLKRLSNVCLPETNKALFLKSGEDLQPLAGVYSTALKTKLNNYLKNGNRMVFGFVNHLEYSTLQVDETELKNLNTPRDLGP